MPKVTQLVLNLPSRPGVLAKVARVLGEAGITLEGVCAAESTGGGRIRLLVSNIAQAQTALQAAKFRYAQEDAIAVPLEDWPGTLAEAAQKLAQAQVNITCVYATAGGDRPPAIVLTVSDLSKSLTALEG